MRLEVSARTSASRSDDPSCTCSFLPAEVLWTAPVQGVHSSWTGGRPLCVSPLSFGNPALISLFPQREACWLPVACGLTKIGPDMMLLPPFCVPRMRTKQIVSCGEEVEVRNLRQQANLKWVRIIKKKNPPRLPHRLCLQSQVPKAPGLSVGQSAPMLQPQELPS